MGDLNECLGCKLDREGDYLHVTQPVLVKPLKDEFKLDGIKTRGTPTEAVQVLVKNNDNELSENEVKKFRRVVGKLLHAMRFSHPEIVNATRELSKFMTSGNSKEHLKAML